MKLIRYTRALPLVLALLVASTLGAQDKRNMRSYAKALETMGATMSLLDRYFVDSVDMERMSRFGIDAMLESLDPYTEYYSRADSEKLKLLTKGEYAGIGAIISQRPDSTVLIQEPMEGMPAALAGLKAGDIILEVDGKDYRKATSEQVSAALKGKQGSKISVLIQRMGERKPRRINFARKAIVMNPIPYAGLTDKGYAYVVLSAFTDATAKTLRKTLQELERQAPLKGLILDLRGNGGGLLQEAVKIVSLFVPHGETVVSTKARPEIDKDETYKTQGKPLYPELPLVVLINGESASSAEIVAGALQDMDRALVLGRKSFGKGLVQTTMGLPDDGVLKLTTAKYYIPSGRSVQRIDYRERRLGKRQSVRPDSLSRTFYTKAGRPVLEAGGITPDIEVVGDSLPTLLYYLKYDPNVFDWVTAYVHKHKAIASPRAFELSDEDYKAFGEMLIEKKFDYDRQSSKELDKLREIARIEGYLERAGALLDSLKQALEPDLRHDLVSLRPQIERHLGALIVQRYYYNRGVIERGMPTDKTLLEAEALLAEPERMRALLSRPASAESKS